jgi:hypothetical protein
MTIKKAGFFQCYGKISFFDLFNHPFDDVFNQVQIIINEVQSIMRSCGPFCTLIHRRGYMAKTEAVS